MRAIDSRVDAESSGSHPESASSNLVARSIHFQFHEGLLRQQKIQFIGPAPEARARLKRP